MNVDWGEVRQYILKELRSSERALRTCDHNEIDLYRGRIQAYEKILGLAEVPAATSVPNFPKM